MKEGSKKYHSDGRIIYSCQYHVIFCPKYRKKVLVDGIDKRLKEFPILKRKLWKGHLWTTSKMVIKC